MKATQYHFAWRHRLAAGRFRTGVSLHSHTMHSRESLDFLPRIARPIPVIGRIVAYEERRYERRNGQPLDYSRAYWTPPLPEREAFLLERDQIQQLGMKALVSLTDHDNIEASRRLHLFEASRGVPISVEWTVPFGPSFFHLGLHNLPREEAGEWMAALAGYTARPSRAVLHDLLAALHRRHDALIVFNHPFWDEKGIGPERHKALVAEFLEECGGWLHAIEFNGTRPWPENQKVIALAESTGRVVISGGDRHGTEANTVVNLSHAESFAEFADEVRGGGLSEILVLPRYREPYRLRYAETIWEIVRDYPEQAGRVRWTERVFYRTESGGIASLADAWGAGNGPAGVVGAFMFAVSALSSPHVRSTLRLALKTKGEVLS